MYPFRLVNLGGNGPPKTTLSIIYSFVAIIFKYFELTLTLHVFYLSAVSFNTLSR